MVLRDGLGERQQLKPLKLLAASAAFFVAMVAHAQTTSTDSMTSLGQTVTVKGTITQGSWDTSTLKWNYTYTVERVTTTSTHHAVIDINSGAVRMQIDNPVNANSGTTQFAANAVITWHTEGWVTGDTQRLSGSHTFTTPAAPPTKKTLRVSMSNPTDFTMVYRVYYSGGQLVDTVTVYPHNDGSKTYSITGGQSVYATCSILDANLSGGLLVSAPGNTYLFTAGTIANSAMTTDTGSPLIVPKMMDGMNLSVDTNTPPQLITGSATNVATPQNVQPIFDSTATNGTGDTAALTKGMFAAGVNQQTGALINAANANAAAIVAAINGQSGGGGSTDMTATNGKLDTLHGDATTANGKLDAVHGDLQSMMNDTPSGVSGFVFSSTGDGTTFAPNSTDAATLSDLMPASPAAAVLPTSITPTSHLTFTISTPAWRTMAAHDYPVDVDVSPWDTQVAFVRGVFLSVLAISFFLLVGNTLKGAVA